MKKLLKLFRFPNKYRDRIENKTAELIGEYQKFGTELKSTRRTLSPEVYSKLWVQRKDIEIQIVLLESLL